LHMTKPNILPVKETTKRKLIALSGNVCAFPGCNNYLVDFEHKTIIMEAAHIKGEQPLALRYDSSQSDEGRRSYSNLIPLCGNCHKIIDDYENKEKYTVAVLKMMKTNHENESKTRIPDLIPANLVRISHLTTINIDKSRTELDYWVDTDGNIGFFDDVRWNKISDVKRLGLELVVSLSGKSDRAPGEDIKIIYNLMQQIPEVKFRDFIRLTTVTKNSIEK
jgi:hypothetical protein